MKAKKEDIIGAVTEIAVPICESLGCKLYDVYFYKEGADYNLCILIDKKGGVAIEDCEAVSRAIDPILDERDPIDCPYCLEVSSCGADRKLTKEAHFRDAVGERITLKFYTAIDGSKTAVGTLTAYSADGLTLEVNGEQKTYSHKDVAQAKIDVDYSKLFSDSEK